MPDVSNPQLKQAFLDWLGHQDTQIRHAIRWTPEDPESSFVLCHGAIELKAALTDRGIEIFAERNGQCWDILLSLVVVPTAVPGGYYCAVCGERRVFPDLDRLWRNHLFGPLLGWMRRRFLRADRLCFYSEPGAWWVGLMRPGDEAGAADEIIEAWPSSIAE